MDFTEFISKVKKVKSSETKEDFALVPYDFFLTMIENFSDIQFSKSRLEDETVSLEELRLELIKDGSIQS